MIEPKILAKGHFKPEHIAVRLVAESNRLINPAIEEQIDGVWEEMYRNAKAKGKQVWNGVTYRLNSLCAMGETLDIEFAPIDFKTQVCLITIPGYYDMPEGGFRKGAYTSAFIRTFDDQYVFVRLSGKSMTQSSEGFPGGILDEDVLVDCSEALFSSLYKEIEEETSIPHTSINHAELCLVALMPQTNVSFTFVVHTKDSSDAIYKRFKKCNNDQDISDLVFVPAQEVFAYLETLDIGSHRKQLWRAKHIFADKAL